MKRPYEIQLAILELLGVPTTNVRKATIEMGVSDNITVITERIVVNTEKDDKREYILETIKQKYLINANEITAMGDK